MQSCQIISRFEKTKFEIWQKGYTKHVQHFSKLRLLIEREERKREQTWFTDGSYTQLFTDCSMQEKLPSFKETF